MSDLQMARGNVEGGYNLAIGEPVLLQKWLDYSPYKFYGPATYPTMDGDPKLIEELRVMHSAGEIVITTGAKQALLAAFYALKKVESRFNIVHNAPYWPSYPTLAKLSGLAFNQPASQPSFDIRMMTAPNNPDGGEYGGDCDIWDAVYASWVYGWSARTPKHRISVHSASKLIGQSGARVGWLVTRDPRIADEARKYVELTTSGVSVVSQGYVAHYLKLMRNDVLVGWKLREAREDMLYNGDQLNKFLGEHIQNVAGVPATGKGMFAYLTAKDPDRFDKALAEAKVAVVTGTACGEKRPGLYRMNMCHEIEYTKAALMAIKEKM